MNVWIVSAEADAEFVRRLRTDLADRGATVALAAEAVHPGEPITARILAAIEESEGIVVVLSSASARSQWVSLETAIALEAQQKAPQKRVIPVLSEAQVRPPALLEHLLYVDLSTPDRYERNLPRLVDALASPSRPSAPNAELRAEIEYLRSQRRSLELQIAARKQAGLVWSWTILTALVSVAAGSLALVGSGASFLRLISGGQVPSGFISFATGVLAGLGSALVASILRRRLHRDEIHRMHEQLERMERLVHAEARQAEPRR